MQSQDLNEMLKNIPDPALRQTYGDIISGKRPYKVYCMNPHKLPGEKKSAHAKGVLIGYIDRNGRCVDEPTTREDGTIISGIETSRDRFDGRKGFRCYCGNWSIQAPEEQPTLSKYKTPVPPSHSDLTEISAAIQKSGKKTGYNFINGAMEYDGFKIEEIK